MQAKILEQSEEELWEEYIENHPFSSIHQTPEWGRFCEKYWIIAIIENGKITGGTLLTRRRLPKGYSWLYAPRGPLATPEQIPALLEIIKEIAKNEKSIFLRIDPFNELQPQGFRAVPYGFQPQHTLILDISAPEDAILAQMKPKGRYNIRLAEKKGVKIKESTDIDAYYKILEETTARDSFHAHPREYYAKMLSTLGPKARLYLAYYEDQPIAGIINTYFKDTATYYFGASSNAHRNLMAPYLLHWQAIQDAKSRGFCNYDLFGIAPPASPRHPWAGVTQFKEKFGGTYTSYPPALELPLRPLLYRAYLLYKRH